MQSLDDSLSLAAHASILQARLRETLHANGLYAVDAYGWRDADTPDPEYMGHNWWQTDPPFGTDWSAMFDGDVPRHKPTVREEQLMTNGDDFTAAMLFARESCGMALCVGDTQERFGFYTATSHLWLAIASDRIREFFLLAMFSESSDKYFKRAGKKEWATPFSEAKPAQTDIHVEMLVKSLGPLSQSLQNFRKHRHDITHDLATRAAIRSRKLLRDQRSRMKPSDSFDSISFEDLISANATDPEQVERQAEVQEIKQWYECLIKVSNLVFLVEHAERGAKP